MISSPTMESIIEKIEQHIQENDLSGGDKLPSERDLSDMWGINRITLRAAIKELVNEGILYSIQGSGTYVSEKKIVRNLYRFSSFSQAMKDAGAEVESRLLSTEIIGSNKKLSKLFKVLLGTEILVIKRLRFVNGKPLAIEISYIPYEYCKGLEDLEEELQQGSLYRILEDKYGIKLVEGEQRIDITYITEEESELLELEPSEPALYLEGPALGENGQIFEFSKSVTRWDRCRFESILR